jgi:hypothetical protein
MLNTYVRLAQATCPEDATPVVLKTPHLSSRRRRTCRPEDATLVVFSSQQYTV